MKLAFLAGFSYPVEVQFRVRFRRSFERGLILWFPDGTQNTAELQRSLDEALDARKEVLLLASHDVSKSIPRTLERWEKNTGYFSSRSLNQNDANQVRRSLVRFLGAEAIDGAVSDEGLNRVASSGKILHVSESEHPRGFKATLHHAGLLGRGVEFEGMQYRFAQRDAQAQILPTKAREYDRLLYASAGLGRLHPNVLRQFAGRIDSGSQALDAVLAFVSFIAGEEEQKDLVSARAIQEALIPKTLPPILGFQTGHYWRPAKRLAGDCYDVIPLGEGVFAIFLADVSGKGPPAALLASNLLGAVRGYASQRLRPNELFHALNEYLFQHTEPAKYATAFYGELDSRARSLVYANAGHNPPVLVRFGGSVELLLTGGRPLGLFPNQQYTVGTTSMDGGDRLVLFTDGVVEASTPRGDEFGDQRLVELCSDSAGISAQDLVERIATSVEEHCIGEFGDDVTLIAVLMTGCTPTAK